MFEDVVEAEIDCQADLTGDFLLLCPSLSSVSEMWTCDLLQPSYLVVLVDLDGLAECLHDLLLVVVGISTPL